MENYSSSSHDLYRAGHTMMALESGCGGGARGTASGHAKAVDEIWDILRDLRGNHDGRKFVESKGIASVIWNVIETSSEAYCREAEFFVKAGRREGKESTNAQ